MKIENTTHWRSDDLRRLVLAGLQHRGCRQPRHLIIKYRRKHAVTLGWAQYSGKRLCLTVERDEVDVRKLANIIDHEIDHLLGLEHREMEKGCLIRDDDQPWADGFAIRKRAEPKKVSAVERREAAARSNLAKAEARLRKLESDLKRARTIQKKWATKVRYYDRQAACREKK